MDSPDVWIREQLYTFVLDDSFFGKKVFFCYVFHLHCRCSLTVRIYCKVTDCFIFFPSHVGKTPVTPCTFFKYYCHVFNLCSLFFLTMCDILLAFFHLKTLFIQIFTEAVVEEKNNKTTRNQLNALTFIYICGLEEK